MTRTPVAQSQRGGLQRSHSLRLGDPRCRRAPHAIVLRTDLRPGHPRAPYNEANQHNWKAGEAHGGPCIAGDSRWLASAAPECVSIAARLSETLAAGAATQSAPDKRNTKRTKKNPTTEGETSIILVRLGKAHGGPCIRIGDFRAGAGIRQLPECVYLSLAEGFVGDSSRLGVPQVRPANPLL